MALTHRPTTSVSKQNQSQQHRENPSLSIYRILRHRRGVGDACIFVLDDFVNYIFQTEKGTRLCVLQGVVPLDQCPADFSHVLFHDLIFACGIPSAARSSTVSLWRCGGW